MTIVFRSVSYTTNGDTATKPSGTVAGDLLLCFRMVYDGTATVTPPSDTVPWTAISGAGGHQVAGGETQAFCFWKIAGASEPSSYKFPLAPFGYSEIVIAAYSGSFDSSAIDGATANTGNDAAPTATGITTTTATQLVAHITGYNNGLSAGPSGMTQRAAWDGANYLFDVAQATAGASGNKAATKGSADSWVASLVALKEASGGGGGSIAGAAAITEAGDTGTAAGALKLAAAATIAEAADTLGSVAKLALIGSGALTEAADTVAATGALGIVGAGAISEAPDTLAASATGVHTGVAALTEASDTIAATGALALAGAAFVTEAGDSIAANGALGIAGLFAAVEAPDTLSARETAAAIVPTPAARRLGAASEVRTVALASEPRAAAIVAENRKEAV